MRILVVALAVLLGPSPAAGQEGGVSAELRACDEAVARAPEDGRVQLDCGVLYRRAYRLDESESCLERAVALLPQNGEPLAQLALLRAARSDDGEAREAAERALALDPGSTLAKQALAMASERARLRGAKPPEPARGTPEHAVWEVMRAKRGWELVSTVPSGDTAKVTVRTYEPLAPDVGRAGTLARALESGVGDPERVRFYRGLDGEDRLAYVRRIANLGGADFAYVDFELRRHGQTWKIIGAPAPRGFTLWWLALPLLVIAMAWLWRLKMRHG